MKITGYTVIGMFFLQQTSARIRLGLSNFNSWGTDIKASPARSLGVLIIAQSSGQGSLLLTDPAYGPFV